MNVCSFSFLLALQVAVTLFHLLPWKSLRRVFLAGLNLAFLVTQVPNRQSWICFAGFLLLTYLALRFLRARPSRNHLIALIGLIVCAFVYLKRYDFLDVIIGGGYAPAAMLDGVELIGISYIFFKAIHMAVDQWDGLLAPYSFFSYLNYQLAFFTLFAGPIQRYNDFQESWEHMDLVPGDVRETILYWRRVLIGMLQMGLVAVLLLQLFEYADKMLHSPILPNMLAGLVGRFYIFPIYLYFNFAGYSNIAIGSAGLLGFRVPENFDYPFLARNMINFWNRWHITLSWWIRDYIFMTSYKFCVVHYPRWSRLCGYALLFLALVVAGMWHGTTLTYLAVGVSFGAGIAVSQMYGDAMRARLRRAGFHRYMQNRAIRAAAIAITFHYVSFCMLIFSSKIEGTLFWFHTAARLLAAPQPLIAALEFNWWWSAGIVALILVGAAWWNSERLPNLLDGLTARLSRSTGMLYAAVYSMAILTTCVLLASWALQQRDAVVVYMKF